MSYKTISLWVLGVFALIASTIYFVHDRHSGSIGKFVTPPPIKGAANLPTVMTPMPQGIRTIDPAALKKIDIPKEIKADPTQHVTQTATVPKSKGGYNIVSVTNDKGETKLLTEEKPPAWLEWQNSGRVGLGAGHDSEHGQMEKVALEYTPLRVLGMTIGVEVEGRSHPTDPRAAFSHYEGIKLFKEF
jgi:hypothetical protein